MIRNHIPYGRNDPVLVEKGKARFQAQFSYMALIFM